MKEDMRTLGAILLVCLLVIFAGLMVFAPMHQKRLQEHEQSEVQRYEAKSALRAIYAKVLRSNGMGTNATGLMITPEEVRRAIARENNEIGEMPEWVTKDMVYVTRHGVQIKSGRMICFIALGKPKAQIPYGVTSTGECRYANRGEVAIEDFVLIKELR